MKKVLDRIKAGYQMIWRDDAMQGKPLRLLQKWLRVLLWTVSELKSGLLQLNAMSLAYITLLSLVPLLAVTFSVLKAFGAHNMVEPTLLTLLEPLGEQAPEITQQVTGFVDSINVGVLGAVGVAVLFYTVINLMQKIETVFNKIWHVDEARPMSTRFSSYLSVIMVGPVMIFAAGALSTALLTTPVIQHLREIAPFGHLIAWVTGITPLLLIILAFAFIYVFIPNTRVRLPAALIGAVIAGLLWHSIGWLFANLVSGSANYSAIYSAFAALVLFMVWLQVAWMIVLLGSLISYAWQNVEALAPEGDLMVLTPAEREVLAVELVGSIGRHFEADRPPPSTQLLAREYGLSARLLVDILRELARHELIRQVRDEQRGWLPARPPAHISLADIMTAIRQNDRPLRVGLHSEAGRAWAAAQDDYHRQVLARRNLSDGNGSDTTATARQNNEGSLLTATGSMGDDSESHGPDMQEPRPHRD